MNYNRIVVTSFMLAVIASCANLSAQIVPGRLFNRVERWLNEFPQDWNNESQAIGGHPRTWGPPLDQGSPRPGQSQIVEETQQVWIPGYYDHFGNWTSGSWQTVVVEREVFVPTGNAWSENFPNRAPRNNSGAGASQRGNFIFQKPEWVLASEHPDSQRPIGFSVTANPTLDARLNNSITALLRIHSGDSLSVSSVHYQGMAVTAPGTQSPQYLVVETQNFNNGQTLFWDIELRPTSSGGWSMPKAEILPMVSGNPPSIDNSNENVQPRPEPDSKVKPNIDYARPSWVVTHPVPGGVFLRDVNEPEIQQDLQVITQMFQSRGTFTVIEVLHAGRQTIGNGHRTYLVVRTSDNDVKHIEFVSTVDGMNVSAKSIKR